MIQLVILLFNEGEEFLTLLLTHSILIIFRDQLQAQGSERWVWWFFGPLGLVCQLNVVHEDFDCCLPDLLVL